jgi:hypothetical protein
MLAFATVPIVAGIGRCEGLRGDLPTFLLRELALVTTPLGETGLPRLAAIGDFGAATGDQARSERLPAAASANCIRATEVIDMSRPGMIGGNRRLRRGSCLTSAAMACSKSASACRRG